MIIYYYGHSAYIIGIGQLFILHTGVIIKPFPFVHLFILLTLSSYIPIPFQIVRLGACEWCSIFRQGDWKQWSTQARLKRLSFLQILSLQFLLLIIFIFWLSEELCALLTNLYINYLNFLSVDWFHQQYHAYIVFTI